MSIEIAKECNVRSRAIWHRWRQRRYVHCKNPLDMGSAMYLRRHPLVGESPAKRLSSNSEGVGLRNLDRVITASGHGTDRDGSKHMERVEGPQPTAPTEQREQAK